MRKYLSNRGLSNVGVVVAILLVLILIGALPVHSWNHDWGYYPSGSIGLVLIVLIIFILLGAI